MATLIELPEWTEGIYQLEEDDLVLGGVDGVDNKQAKQLANRTAYLKQEVEKRASINNPTFTGTAKAPTPQQTVNDTTLATTEFVKTAIAALVGSAPAALDTLSEIAAALGGDANLKKVLLDEIGKKTNQTDFTTLKNILVGIPFPYPLSAVPVGCLAMNGQRFDTGRYQKLAQKYPSGVLPDLRGEFIRGWDNGRNVDGGRALLSSQGDAMQAIKGAIGNFQFIDSTLCGSSGALAAALSPRAVNLAQFYSTSKNIGEGTGRIELDSSKVSRTANENRPRNIAYHYICLAE